MKRVSSFRWSGAGLLAVLAATVFVPMTLTAEEPGEPEAATYQLEAGDRIEVRVFGHAEFTVRLRVPPRGRVSFPAILPIALRGQAIAEVEREITTQLKGRGILKEPLVTVLVVDFEPRSVYVLGSVNRAGENTRTPRTSASSARARTGTRASRSTSARSRNRRTPRET